MKANEFEKTMGYRRSEKWEEVRKTYLAEFPKCSMCEVTGAVEAHHIYPFHICIELGRPDLELDKRNLVTLCEGEGSNEHHFLIGHLGGWESFNTILRADLKVFKGTTQDEIRQDRLWQLKSEKRIEPFEEITPDEKKILKDEINKRMPILGETKEKQF